MPEPRTITEAAELIRRGELTPAELLDQCLARVDRHEPKVRAWVVLDREGAYEQAERLTAELKAGQNRGPLHGIPVGIKDIIDVFDLPTGCGSMLWANSYARRDATCVARLRQAGAVIMGKTVTTAFAYMDPPVTRNPWNLDRTPGGSSSGSAAAVACGMCLGALGTQTGGSVTRPASFCGVCSLKPTHGRISVDGVLPFAPSLDHIGVMANCVPDLAILFHIVAGYDPGALMTRARPVPDCVQSIDRELAEIEAESRRGEPRNRKRFLRPAEMYPAHLHPEMARFMQNVERDLSSLAHADADVQAIVLPPEFGEIHHRHRQVMALEAAETHADRLRRHPDDYPPRIRGLITDGLVVSATELGRAEYIRRELEGVLSDAFWPHPLLTPATLGPAPTPETTGDPWCNSPWSFLGLPTVSVPLGWSSDGLPLAVQFVGGEYREDYLLARAAWVERVFRMDGVTEDRPLPL
jgi:Asp-tRNA(Asn)/Glu-tRNA(Gln) amidotransferase A subunit family amidase